MKKVSMILFIFVLMFGVVCSSDEWGAISSEEENINEFPSDNLNIIEEVIEDTVANKESPKNEHLGDNNLPSFFSSDRYTDDFYIALGIGGIGILLVLLFFYLFIRGPKNKWKKKHIKKKIVKKKKKKGKPVHKNILSKK